MRTSDIFATDDGGIIFSYDQSMSDREVSIVIPADRSIIYYTAYERSSRVSSGVAMDWKAVERLINVWLIGGPLPLEGIIEGSERPT